MAIQYTFQRQDQTLIVTTSGFDESLEEVMLYGMAVIQEAVLGEYATILCDETQLEYRLGILDTYEAAEFMSRQAASVAKAAIVCDEKNIKDAKFWETVAVNRGLIVRVFRDIESAHLWLSGGQS